MSPSPDLVTLAGSVAATYLGWQELVTARESLLRLPRGGRKWTKMWKRFTPTQRRIFELLASARSAAEAAADKFRHDGAIEIREDARGRGIEQAASVLGLWMARTNLAATGDSASFDRWLRETHPGLVDLLALVDARIQRRGDLG